MHTISDVFLWRAVFLLALLAALLIGFGVWRFATSIRKHTQSSSERNRLVQVVPGQLRI